MDLNNKIYSESHERPGGLYLTKKLVDALSPQPGSQALDVGCGKGDTIKFLRREYKIDAVGIDKIPVDSPFIYEFDASDKLPFPDSHFDLILFECSLSCIDNPDAVLKKMYNLLKPNGHIIVTDIYSKSDKYSFDGLVGRIESLDRQLEMFEKSGFVVSEVEKHDDLLQSFFAALVFENGFDETVKYLGGCCSIGDLKNCGYYSLILDPKQKPATTVGTQTMLSPFRDWIGHRTGIGKLIGRKSLLDWQLDKAMESVIDAKKYSSFYQNHLRDVDTQTKPDLDWFENIPFTNGGMISEYGEQMLAVGLGEVSRIRTIPTSGSTGDAKRIWFTDLELNRTSDFFAYGMSQIAPPGGFVCIMMSTDKPWSIASLLREGLSQIDVGSQILGKLSRTEDIAKIDEKTDCIVGMPADVLYLSRYVPDLSPKTVLLSADYISPSVVGQIEKNWGCKVFCHYGLTETGYGLAVECNAQSGQHIRLADYLLEIVDPITGKVLSDGDIGEIVLTSLKPKAMPIIRYRTGDISYIEPNSCGCGCDLPRLGRILGRGENLSNALNINKLDDIIYSIDGIAGYYISGNKIVIESDDFDILHLQKLLGNSIKINRGEAPPWIYSGKRWIMG